MKFATETSATVENLRSHVCYNLVIAGKLVWDILLKMLQKHHVLLIHVITRMSTERSYDFVYITYGGDDLGYALR